MYRERVFSCAPDHSRRLLDGDVLAMKTWGTTGQLDDSGHQNEKPESKTCSFCLEPNMNFPDFMQNILYIASKKKKVVHKSKKGHVCNLLPVYPNPPFISTGLIDTFSCCLLGNKHGFPLSFFGIHILGGLVLFFSDGIVVSRISTSVI